MRILIIGDKIEDRKNIEHLLISNNINNFHSIGSEEDINFYTKKIEYAFAIFIGENLMAEKVLKMKSSLPEATTTISITKDLSISDNIISFHYQNGHKEKLTTYINTQKTTNYLPKEDILIKINDKYKRIRLEDIDFIQSDGKYITLNLGKRKFSLRNTLKGIELILPNYFVRAHSSYIVNLNKIESIHIAEQNVELTNSSIPFSRKYKSNLLNRFHLG
ncbi:MAG: hypothetical protein HKO66_10195 [Saprospiraceae bacterium]|nr:LytTR family transcriptional regulator DNA-binding domain-containing protein [Bacteroidia bacterium]NNE15662.1 hypothetical protein [Saprospiraceae bacterium]NNL92592.1 hypothetical protein [Saprospiraceae bacterium]